MPGFKHSSTRANVYNLLNTVHLRCEISYETFSSQKNDIDIVFGIQSNKNQLNASNIPIPLIRLVEHIKKDKWDQIKTYFENLIYEKIKQIFKRIKLKEIILDLKQNFGQSYKEPNYTSSPESTPPSSPESTPPSSPQATSPSSPQATSPSSSESTPSSCNELTPPQSTFQVETTYTSSNQITSNESTSPSSIEVTPASSPRDIETISGENIINNILNTIDPNRNYKYDEICKLFDNLKALITVDNF